MRTVAAKTALLAPSQVKAGRFGRAARKCQSRELLGHRFRRSPPRCPPPAIGCASFWTGGSVSLERSTVVSRILQELPNSVSGTTIAQRVESFHR